MSMTTGALPPLPDTDMVLSDCMKAVDYYRAGLERQAQQEARDRQEFERLKRKFGA